MRTVKPEQVGIESTYVTNFLTAIHKRNLPMHSLLLLRGDQLFLEAYWEPYTKDSIQRMYSSTKSFVSVGVGLAEEDGLIDLDKPIASYFPEKLCDETDPEVLALTVRQMLTMTTAGHPGNWFVESIADRTKFYFRKRLHYLHPAGTRWHYDSPASQVLCALVEKVTGKNFLSYMQERLFCHMDAFQNARMLKVGNGDSWGDSAMLCTSRDFAKFALFVMRLGNWNGKQILNKAYLQTATSRVVDNRIGGFCGLDTHGYGYQFWKTEKDGFAMIGMGGQMAICLPKQDLILVCTADLQGVGYARDYITAQFLDIISDHLQDAPLPENEEKFKELDALSNSLELFALKDMPDSPLRKEIDGVVYQCTPNGLGWKQFSLRFEGDDGGVLQYVKESGVKNLPFYVNRNRFCKFPEEGYSGEFGGQVTIDGSLYDAAVSAAWVQSNKFQIHVQIVDDYLGHLLLDIGFRDDKAVVTAMKYAENFMNDYKGEAVGVRVKQ